VKIKFHVFGYEVANIELDIPEPEPQTVAATAVERGVKGISRLWVHLMSK